MKPPMDHPSMLIRSKPSVLDYVRGITSEAGDVEWLSVVGKKRRSAFVEKNQPAVRGEPVDE
jgi:hypothetical protein